jgi:dolichol kinase
MTSSTLDPKLIPLVASTEGLQPWRRIFHASAGVALVYLLHRFEPGWGMTVGGLGSLAVVLFALDALRLGVPALNRLFFRAFPGLVSPREAQGIASSTWYAVGCALTLALFPRPLAMAAILVLALADPAASYAGRRWGRRRTGTGTWLGTGVFVGVACGVLLAFAPPISAVLVALLVGLVERTRWVLDDNLVVPLVTGALLWTLLPLF